MGFHCICNSGVVNGDCLYIHSFTKLDTSFQGNLYWQFIFGLISCILPFYRQLIFSHRQSLLRSLKEEQDPAMALHIILVLLFQQKTNCILHIPGKFIPTLISFLSDHVPSKEHMKLAKCQRLISAKWKLSLTHDSEVSKASEPNVIAETEDTDEDSHETIADSTQSSDDSEAAIQALIQELQCLVH